MRKQGLGAGRQSGFRQCDLSRLSLSRLELTRVQGSAAPLHFSLSIHLHALTSRAARRRNRELTSRSFRHEFGELNKTTSPTDDTPAKAPPESQRRSQCGTYESEFTVVGLAEADRLRRRATLRPSQQLIGQRDWRPSAASMAHASRIPHVMRFKRKPARLS